MASKMHADEHDDRDMDDDRMERGQRHSRLDSYGERGGRGERYSGEGYGAERDEQHGVEGSNGGSMARHARAELDDDDAAEKPARGKGPEGRRGRPRGSRTGGRATH